ncbi:hypothetical protein VP01_7865g2, partial [Puccinia sorghi]
PPPRLYKLHTVESFHSLDLVLVDQSNQGEIIVIIEFTPLDQLSKSKKKDINFVTTFLHQSKQFFEYSWNFKIVGWKNVGRGLASAIFTKAMLSTSSTIWMCFKHPRPNVSKSRWHSFGITSPPNSFLTKLIFSISSVPTGQSRAEALKVHWVYSMKWIWLLKPFLKESTAAWIIEAPYTFRKLIKHSKDTLTSGFSPLIILTIKTEHERVLQGPFSKLLPICTKMAPAFVPSFISKIVRLDYRIAKQTHSQMV